MTQPDTRAGLRLSLLAALAVPAVFVTAVLVRRTDGAVPRFDARVVRAWSGFADRNGWVHDLALVLTQLGGPLLVEAVAVVGALLMWRAGRRRRAAFVLVAVLGAQLVSYLSKVAVHRGRPCDAFELVTCPGTYSFPSGHSVGAAASWLTLALIVRAHWRRRFLVLAVVVPLVVGATRLLLGVHFPSDVLAGLALGWAWVVGCAQVFHTWRQEEIGELVEGRR